MTTSMFPTVSMPTGYLSQNLREAIYDISRVTDLVPPSAMSCPNFSSKKSEEHESVAVKLKETIWKKILDPAGAETT